MDMLLTVGLIGSFMAAVTAMQLSARPPEPVPVRTTDDIDAEFFRIIEREWHRDIHQPRYRHDERFVTQTRPRTRRRLLVC